MTKVALSVAKKLISFQSYSGSEGDIAAFLCDTLADLGYNPILQDGNVVAHIGGQNRKKAILLSGHMDTVSEGDASLWTKDPFSANEENGKLYGLGSTDMKAGIAGYFEVLNRLGPVPPVDIWLVFVTREEISGAGSQSFVKWFKENHSEKYSSVECIIAEPTDANFLGIGHRGNIFANIKISGKGSHASLDIEDNQRAILLSQQCVEMLTQLTYEWKEKYNDNPLGPPTIAVTAASAGSRQATNVIPATSEIVIDIRTIPAMHNHALEIIKSRLTSISGCEISIIDQCPAGWTDEKSALRTIAKTVFPDLRQEPTLGAADLCFFVEENIPTVLFGPGTREVMHATNEYVVIDNIKTSIDITTKLIQYFGEAK